jgi:hypothetical protein
MNKSLIFIIDTSYSVNHILENYVKSINNIIDVQLSINPTTKFSIVTFNTKEKYICINEVIGNTKRRITRDDLNPTGFTALYDSVSAILIHLNNFFKINKSEPPLVIILTDGDDTSSKLLTRKHLYLQICRNKAKGWKFIYLGVTENSLQLGRDIGSDISILYNTSEDCFSFLPNVFKELFSKPIVSNVQIDLNEIMENMKNLKI